jgi:hypothetical protein
MTTPINMALYRFLMKHGAEEIEAEAAARIDVTDLVTKADLKAELAELRASLLIWIVTMFIGQTALLLTVLRMMQP